MQKSAKINEKTVDLTPFVPFSVSLQDAMCFAYLSKLPAYSEAVKLLCLQLSFFAYSYVFSYVLELSYLQLKLSCLQWEHFCLQWECVCASSKD